MITFLIFVQCFQTLATRGAVKAYLASAYMIMRTIGSEQKARISRTFITTQVFRFNYRTSQRIICMQAVIILTIAVNYIIIRLGTATVIKPALMIKLCFEEKKKKDMLY